MASIDLSRIVSVAPDSASDSRRRMKEIAKLLGLDAEATEEQILEALKGRLDAKSIAKALDLKDDATEQEILDAIKANEAEPAESLEDRAKAEGKTVLTNDELQTLRADSKAGKEARDELRQSKFDRAYDKALDEVRIQASDETKEEWQELYDAVPEATLKRMAKLPKLANTSSRGGSGEGGGAVPDGVDEERFALNEKVEARMVADDCDYETALRKVRAEEKV